MKLWLWEVGGGVGGGGVGVEKLFRMCKGRSLWGVC
jgi:hypothetical protein